MLKLSASELLSCIENKKRKAEESTEATLTKKIKMVAPLPSTLFSLDETVKNRYAPTAYGHLLPKHVNSSQEKKDGLLLTQDDMERILNEISSMNHVLDNQEQEISKINIQTKEILDRIHFEAEKIKVFRTLQDIIPSDLQMTVLLSERQEEILLRKEVA
jgi:hypothetical protein